MPAGEKLMYVNWIHVKETITPSPCTNVAIASYPTGQARIKLYRYLDKLQDRVLYQDTDSVIYISRKGELDLETGNYLGDLTDELEVYGKGSYIVTFMPGGPKFYAYRVRSPRGATHDVCKVKGIRLNYENSTKINFDSISRLILYGNNDACEREEEVECINITNNVIRRTKAHDVITRKERKICRVVLKKRQFISKTYSVPYGYKY